MKDLKNKAAFKGYWKALVLALLFTISSISVDCYSLEPPPITPIDEFFTLGTPPNVPDDWHLLIDGAVEKPLSLTLNDIMQYPATTQMSTLECYFPTGVGLLVGNANWTGVHLKDMLLEAVPNPEAVSVTFHAIDGYSMGPYSLSDMLSRDDFLLAYGMNGQTLPPEQGYPLKLVLPGIAGYQNARWLERIEISTSLPTIELNNYPIHARIFEPHRKEVIALGTYTIRGMAFAGEGIDINSVEVSIDDGQSWEPARILNYYVPNVWKLWEFTWVIPQVGEYLIFARAIDSFGNVQREESGDFGWRGFGVFVNVDYDCPNLDGLNPVNFVDFSILANNWLSVGVDLAGDLNKDGIVDMNDIGIFTDYWLDECYE